MPDRASVGAGPTADARSATLPHGYYEWNRAELLPLVPRHCRTILDVGCATGSFGRLLKIQDSSRIIHGIELVPDVAAVAAEVLDQVHTGNAELVLDQLVQQRARFDLVVVADVLEHMTDPWRVVRLARELLSDEGFIVASIPNVRHISILTGLFLKGRWDYADAGILDRTHLRFFTKASIRDMFQSSGFTIEQWLTSTIGTNPKHRLAARLAGLCLLNPSLSDDLVAMQYLFRCRK